MACSVFVTATDTDAGKSFLTASLIRALLGRSVDAVALKPVSCGREPGALNADIATLLAAQGMDAAQADAINLYDFAACAAPLFAARAEGARVDVDELAAWCRGHSDSHALSLIEGVGGLMAPLAEKVLVSDWLQALPGARVLLVVRARLGGINQALISIDKLQRMGRNPDWVVVNAADAGGDACLAQHCAAISPYLEGRTGLYELPWLPGGGDARDFLNGSRLLTELEGIARQMQSQARKAGELHAGIDC